MLETPPRMRRGWSSRESERRPFHPHFEGCFHDQERPRKLYNISYIYIYIVCIEGPLPADQPLLPRLVSALLRALPLKKMLFKLRSGLQPILRPGEPDLRCHLEASRASRPRCEASDAPAARQRLEEVGRELVGSRKIDDFRPVRGFPCRGRQGLRPKVLSLAPAQA